VAASDSALLYVILCPTGPYFRSGPKPLSLLAVDEHVRSWPGGTGGFKLGLNYAPGFHPQREAAKKGYDQILWLLGDKCKITEAGAMNVLVVVKRDDGGSSMILSLSTMHQELTERFCRPRCFHAALRRNHSSWNNSRLMLSSIRCSYFSKSYPSRCIPSSEDLRRRACHHNDRYQQVERSGKAS
jgi:hypothetical protein